MPRICITIMDSLPQVLGVIDVTRSKEKGYQTLVKDGFCAEVLQKFVFVQAVISLIFLSSNSFVVLPVG